MSTKPNPLAVGDLHALVDAEFGPCLIRDCPTSVLAKTDLDVLWELAAAADPEAPAPML